MTPSPHLGNVVLVMYQPQDIVNVAGVIRAMSNFGLARLRVVRPAAFDPFRILGIAHHTEALVERVELFDSLDEAIADCGFVVGTTGRVRGVTRAQLSPRAAAPALLRAAGAGAGTVAVLFGREQDGLPNSALDQCHAVLSIPTAPENRSLNLAQAALLICYELWLTANERAAADTPPVTAPTRPDLGDADLSGVLGALQTDAALATGTQREEMFQSLAALLRALYPGTTEARMVQSMARLRAILLRSAPRREEARLLGHLFAHLAQRLR